MTEPKTDGPPRVDARQAALDAAEIRATLLETLKTLREQNLEKLMDFYVNSPETVAIGSYGQPLVGYDSIRAVFEDEFQKQAPTDMVTMGNVRVVSYGTFAVATSTSTRFVKGEDGRTSQQVGRHTTVLEKHGGHWKMIQSHFSVPMKFEETGQAK